MVTVRLAEIRLPLLGAVFMLFLGTYLLALVNSLGPDFQALKISAIVTGPIIMMSGWFCRFIRPNSKAGWITINYGFNFLCGFPLQVFNPLHPGFAHWDSYGFILTALFLMVIANSWMTIHSIYAAFKHAKLWGKLPSGSHFGNSAH